MFASRRLPDVIPAAPVTHTRAANGKASPTEAWPGCDPDRKQPEVNPSAAINHAPAIDRRAAAPEAWRERGAADSLADITSFAPLRNAGRPIPALAAPPEVRRDLGTDGRKLRRPQFAPPPSQDGGGSGRARLGGGQRSAAAPGDSGSGVRGKQPLPGVLRCRRGPFTRGRDRTALAARFRA